MPWVEETGSKTAWLTGSSGALDCCRQFSVTLLCGTLCVATGCLLCLSVATVIISVPMVALGVMYLKQCRSEPLIPVYLLLGGVGIIVTCSTNCCYQCCKRQDRGSSGSCTGVGSVICASLLLIINLAMLAWFILGSVLIYQTFDPAMVTDPQYDFTEVCNKSAYMFAFWLQTITFILVCVVIVTALALCLCKVTKCCC